MNNRQLYLASVVSAALALTSANALAQTNKRLADEQMGEQATMGSMKSDTHTKAADMKMAKGTWLTLGGEVTAISDSGFTLNYGDGDVTVSTDQTHLDSQTLESLKGEKVVVSAMLSDSTFKENHITAESVYAESLGSNFVSDNIDSHSADLERQMLSNIDDDDEQVTVVGEVHAAEGDQLYLQVGGTMLTIELEDTQRSSGSPKAFRTGDTVRVTGELEDDFFEDTTLEADAVLKMNS